MRQQALFKDLSSELLAAIGADVAAAGGEKAVGMALWPKLSSETAQRRMLNVLNSKQKHELSADDMWALKQMARRAVGRSRVFEFEAGELRADLHWVTDDEHVERKERAIEETLDKALRELQELKEARQRAVRPNGR